MQRQNLLIVTALSEGGTGLTLLAFPSIILSLLGAGSTSPEVTLVSRIAGAALVAIGVACWLARGDHGTRAQFGLLTGILIYDMIAAGLLAYAGLGLEMRGIALWPAVFAHAALAVWCALCIRSQPAKNAI